MINSLISVITPTFNCENFIRETYNTLIDQTYSDWEWIVTDDASTDSTAEILKTIASNDPRINLKVRQYNGGAAVSRNCSLKRSNGRYIAFLDSDDLWMPEKLKTQIEFMNSKNCDICFSSYCLISENGQALNKYVDINVPELIGYNDLLKKKATFGCSTVMIDKQNIPDFTMPLIRTGQDYATWLLILKQGYKAHHLKKILTSYRIRSNSISRNKFKKAKRQWKIYREIEHISILKSAYYFFNYAYRALFRN